PDPYRRIEHGGRDFYFCGDKCMGKFRTNPAAYVGDSSKPEASTVSSDGTVYTCPMHPQVRQPSPGNCPICGMSLEPLLPLDQEEENPELRDFQRRFWLTLPLTVLVTVLAMAG
ncbi:heavy metal-binding domain-containing protein, partial [Acinetobacter baumannii]